MSPVTEEMKAKAEVSHGDETCRERFTLLLSEMGLPAGLMAVQHIEECGYVKEAGFVWLRLHDKETHREHRFDNVVVRFDSVVTAYFEPKKITKLTGVKAKEFLVWFSLCEIYVVHDHHHSSSSASSNNGSIITFKTSVAGLSKSFPVSVFQADDRKEKEVVVVVMKKMNKKI